MNSQSQFILDALRLRTPVMLRIVEAMTDGAFYWLPPNQSNSVAWLLWHIAEVEDNWVRDRIYNLPKRFPFGQGVRTMPIGSYPNKAELLAYFHEIRALTQSRLEEHTDADFDRVVQDEHFGQITVR